MKTRLLSAARNTKVLILLVFMGLFTITLANSQQTYAAPTCDDDPQISRNCPGYKEKSNPNCKGAVNDCSDQYLTQCAKAGDCDIVKKYVNPMIRFLILLVGIAVVIGIIKGGYQYIMSTGDPQKAVQAKDSIRNAIIALLMYIFLYAVLRFLVPGDYFIL